MTLKVAAVAAAGLLAVALLPLLMVPGAGGADIATACGPAAPGGPAGPVGVILDTIRTVETGGNYQTRVTTSSASGAYAFVDTAWRHYAAHAGVDTARYPSAWMAPPPDQDAATTVYINELLAAHDGRVEVIPVAWYLPSALDHPELMDRVPFPQAGNRLTIRQYQTKWMGVYQRKLAAAGNPQGPAAAATTTTAATTTSGSDGASADPASDPTPTSSPAAGGSCPAGFAGPGGAVSPDGRWALPAPKDVLALAGITSPHHDYPAVDLMMNEGTPIYAVTDGTVVRTTHYAANWWRSGCPKPGCATCGMGITIQRADGLRHTYCHNRAIYVHDGDQVTPGQHIADSGDTGRSGAPHMHLEFRINNIQHCPQPLLDALYNDRPPPAAASLPTSGCSF